MSSRSPLGYQNAQIAYIKWHGTVSPLYAWSETSGCGEQFAYIVYVYVYMRAVSCFSHVPLFATLWAVACQAPLSMGFSKQEYWTGLLFPSPGNLSNPRIKPMSPALAGRFFTTEPREKSTYTLCLCSSSMSWKLWIQFQVKDIKAW